MTRPYSPLWEIPHYPQGRRPIFNPAVEQCRILPICSSMFHKPFVTPDRTKKNPPSKTNGSNKEHIHSSHSWVFRTHRRANQYKSGDSTNSKVPEAKVQRETAIAPVKDKKIEEKKICSFHHPPTTSLMNEDEWRKIRVRKCKEHRRKLKFLLDEPLPSELPLPCAIPKDFDIPATSDEEAKDDDGVADYADQHFEEEYAQRLAVRQKKSDTLQALREVSMGGRPSSSCGKRQSLELPLLNTRPSSAPHARRHHSTSPLPIAPLRTDRQLLENPSATTYFFPDIEDLPEPGRDDNGYMLAVSNSPPIERHSSHLHLRTYSPSSNKKNEEYDAFRNSLAQASMKKRDLEIKTPKLYREHSRHELAPQRLVMKNEDNSFRRDSPWLSHQASRENTSLSRGQRSRTFLAPWKSVNKFSTALRNDRWAPSFLVQEYYMERESDK